MHTKIKKDRTSNISIYWLLLPLCYFVILFFTVHNYVSHYSNSQISAERNSASISDFHYYMSILSSVELGIIENPYTYQNQKEALTDTIGIKISEVMPIGLSPSSIIVLKPFSRLYIFNPILANTLWTILGLTTFIFGFFAVIYFGKMDFILFFALVPTLPFVFSYNFVSAIFLGQTSLFATGCLLLLFSITSIKKTDPLSIIFVLICISFLSIKIPYLTLALSITILSGSRFYILASIFTPVFLSTLTSIFYDYGMFFSWIEQLAVFGSNNMPTHYRLAFNPETYLTIASALDTFAPPAYLNLLSKTLLVIGIPLIIFSARFGRPTTVAGGEGSNRCILHLVLLFMLQLCCYPYLGGYEDLLIMVPVLLVCISHNRPRPELALIIPLLVLVSLTSNKFFLVGHVPFWSLFAVKLGVFVILLTLCRRRGVELTRQSVC